MSTRTRAPINLALLDPDNYIQRYGTLPVSSHLIHEPSSGILHPSGLFSEVIFGQVGDPKRLITCGYIDLRSYIFQPIIYKNILSLKSFYGDIMSGKIYAEFDKKEKDFIRSDSEYAETGYSFFLEHFNKIEFKETGSFKRKDKISILNKYKHKLLIDKIIVMPAGLRDIREVNGRMESEDINKLYLNILSLSKGLPFDRDDDISPVFDSQRYAIQQKVLELYEYVFNIIEGKKGYAQGKFAARAIALGARNVITSAAISSATSPDAPDYFKNDEILMPLFQAAKSMTPLAIHKLRKIFFEQVFVYQSTNVPLINPKTLALEYHEVSDKVLSDHTTDDGIEKWIDLLVDPSLRHKPVVVSCLDKIDRYMYLVYENDNTIQYFRNLSEFRSHLTGEHYYSAEPISDSIETLKEIGLNKEDIIVVGSGAMLLRGYPFRSEDLDIRISDAQLKRISNLPNVEETDRSFRYKNIEIYKPHKDYPSFDSIYKTADKIDEVGVLPLSSVLSNYQQNNRLKDRDKIKWLKTKVFDKTKVRPATYGELLYCAMYIASSNKYTTATRYPVTGQESTLVSKIHLISTTPSKIMEVKMTTSDYSITLPRYPIVDATYQESLSVHPITLAGYDGEYSCRRWVAPTTVVA